MFEFSEDRFRRRGWRERDFCALIRRNIVLQFTQRALMHFVIAFDKKVLALPAGGMSFPSKVLLSISSS